MQNRALIVAARRHLGYIDQCPTTSTNSKPTCSMRPCVMNRGFAPVRRSLRTKRPLPSCGPSALAMTKYRNSSRRGNVTFRRRRSAGFAGNMSPGPSSTASARAFSYQLPAQLNRTFHLQPARLGRLFPIHAVPKSREMITENIRFRN